jgi:hypothetical protein
MSLKHVFYADGYTRRIVDEITENHNIVAEFFRIHNPTFHVWSSWVKKHRHRKIVKPELLPSSSMLIGGNRWRHHFALNLTDLPIVSIDAHTDMNYDEMIFLKLVRPYNWLYFRLLDGSETHLVLPYSNFRGGRWNIVVPEKYIERFHLYSFDKKRSSAEISLSIKHSRTVEIRNLEPFPPILEVNKQISLDWDITREIEADRVEKLVASITREGDVCDIWLDEGKRGKRNTLKDDIDYCSRIYEILDSA